MVLLQDGPITEASHLIKKDESRADDSKRPRASDDDDLDDSVDNDDADQESDIPVAS